MCLSLICAAAAAALWCSGKTSLLFQYAFQLACSGQEVVFICDRAQLDQAPPLLPFGVSQQHAAFSRIHFK
jgi:hypothetical protein